VEIRCPITTSVRRLNDRINDYLGEITLADLLNPHPNTIGPVHGTGARHETPAGAKGK
jgi:DNA-binding IscR family transcriptional regulator